MSETSDDTTAGPENTRRGRMFQRADSTNVPLRTILVTVGVVVLVYLSGLVLYRLRVLLLLMLMGCFMALLLNPLVVVLEGWGIKRRGAAVGIVAVLSLAAFSGLAFAFGYPLINSLTHLSNSLPAYVRQAQTGHGWLGHLITKYHVEAWITKNSSKLISFAQGLSKPALALGKGAMSVILALLTVFTFSILLLMEAPKLKVAILQSLSPSRAARLERVSKQVSRSATGYMLGNLVTSLVAGVVVFTSLTIMGVPFAFLWALWVALVDFLPTIGGALAGIPTILFAFGHSLSAGLVTFVVFMVYTQLENHVLNPLIMSRTVKLNPLVVFIAVLIGAEVGAWLGGLFGGFIAVLLAVPLAATIHSLVREVWSVRSEVSDT